jgi:hypothetical protein
MNPQILRITQKAVRSQKPDLSHNLGGEAVAIPVRVRYDMS